MTPRPSYVVLRVRKETPCEWFGTLTTGLGIYARARDGSWNVRVAELVGQDALDGKEIGTGVYNAHRAFSYRMLKLKTKGLVLWPEREDEPPQAPASVVTPDAPACHLYERIAEDLGL